MRRKSRKTNNSHKTKESAAGQEWRACIVWGLAALLVLLVHSLVVVGGVLRAPWHGVLGVLSLRVLCQVAGRIRNVVHATFMHSFSVMPHHDCKLQLHGASCLQGEPASESRSQL